jgi:hypothetical protein
LILEIKKNVFDYLSPFVKFTKEENLMVSLPKKTYASVLIYNILKKLNNIRIGGKFTL